MINIPSGQYKLIECILTDYYNNYAFKYTLLFYENGIPFNIKEKSITTINPIIIKAKNDYPIRHEVTQINDTQPLIEEFKKLDKNNYWKDFNFGDFENELNTETN